MNSIIIPVYNNSTFTNQLLNQIKDFNGEIIVVNDGSTDNTVEVVARFPKVKLVSNEKNLGFAKSVNIGYANSTGEKICFLNNDVKFTGKSLADIDNLFSAVKENTLSGPTGGFVNPKTFSYEYHTDAINKKINYICGWCLVGTKPTFDKFMKSGVGPFVEDFETYFEDTYMGYESLKLGVKFRIIRAPFTHFGKVTTSGLDLRTMFTSAKEKFIEKVKQNFTDDELQRLGKRNGFE